jgi:hypothetical protein
VRLLQLLYLNGFGCTLKKVDGINSVSMGDGMEQQIVAGVFRQKDLVHALSFIIN